jgi:SAM-dependent methyltransferase
MLHEDRRRAESFGEDAERYDRTRPSYPARLVDALLAEPARSVLDVGCGTGIAGSLFSSRGCAVVGVEPDERMARIARERGLAVEVASFEHWEPRGRQFDLLISGQAWHWVDPDAGAAKAASVLSAAGRVALFWNFGRPDGAAGDVLAEVYRRLEPELERYSILLGKLDTRLSGTTDALRRSGCFPAPEIDSWSWERGYTTAQWIEQLLTHSDHRTLPPPRRAALVAAVREAIDGLGGTLEMSYETRLVRARLDQ